MQDTPVVMAVQATIRESERSVAIAFADLTKRQLGMTEFLDDDQYTCLESAMVALGCRECVIPQENVKSPDARKLRDVMARCNVLVTEKKKTNFRFCIFLVQMQKHGHDVVSSLDQVTMCAD
jgi:DNA mismatch repair protein MSH2